MRDDWVNWQATAHDLCSREITFSGAEDVRPETPFVPPTDAEVMRSILDQLVPDHERTPFFFRQFPELELAIFRGVEDPARCFLVDLRKLRGFLNPSWGDFRRPWLERMTAPGALDHDLQRIRNAMNNERTAP